MADKRDQLPRGHVNNSDKKGTVERACSATLVYDDKQALVHSIAAERYQFECGDHCNDNECFVENASAAFPA
eukprot:4751472-Karenia_brevis.AAC.1